MTARRRYLATASATRILGQEALDVIMRLASAVGGGIVSVDLARTGVFCDLTADQARRVSWCGPALGLRLDPEPRPEPRRGAAVLEERRGPRLRRLKVLRHPRVRSGEELTFSDGWNVFLGPCGSGKTTALRLAVAALSGNFADVHFDEPVSLEYEVLCDGQLRRHRLSAAPAGGYLEVEYEGPGRAPPKYVPALECLEQDDLGVGRGSFGERRWRALLARLEASAEALAADEPAAGLQHSLVEALVEALGERQVFVAVSGSTFLDYVALDEPRDARETLVLCRQEAGLLTYRRPSEEESEALAWKYRVGLQQTGDLLRTEGLW